jgi:hypothetical protein
MSDETSLHWGSLDSALQPYAAYFVNAVRAAGVPLVIISGRRSAATNQAVGGAERSLHLYGFAFDVQVVGYRREDIPLNWWYALGSFWEAMGGRWGGRFDPPDVNHFDAGYSVEV